MAKYKDEFFRDRHARTSYAAETILGILQPALPALDALARHVDRARAGLAERQDRFDVI